MKEGPDRKPIRINGEATEQTYHPEPALDDVKVMRKKSDFKLIFEKHKELVTSVIAKISASIITSDI